MLLDHHRTHTSLSMWTHATKVMLFAGSICTNGNAVQVACGCEVRHTPELKIFQLAWIGIGRPSLFLQAMDVHAVQQACEYKADILLQMQGLWFLRRAAFHAGAGGVWACNIFAECTVGVGACTESIAAVCSSFSPNRNSHLYLHHCCTRALLPSEHSGSAVRCT